MLSTKGFARKPSVKPSKLRCLWLHFTAFDPEKKDWPRSQELLNVAPKATPPVQLLLLIIDIHLGIAATIRVGRSRLRSSYSRAACCRVRRLACAGRAVCQRTAAGAPDPGAAPAGQPRAAISLCEAAWREGAERPPTIGGTVRAVPRRRVGLGQSLVSPIACQCAHTLPNAEEQRDSAIAVGALAAAARGPRRRSSLVHSPRGMAKRLTTRLRPAPVAGYHVGQMRVGRWCLAAWRTKKNRLRRRRRRGKLFWAAAVGWPWLSYATPAVCHRGQEEGENFKANQERLRVPSRDVWVKIRPDDGLESVPSADTCSEDRSALDGNARLNAASTVALREVFSLERTC
ncbi:hypothetical protein GGX14DRAFT_662748 [Mycena pura]|uniref:Uncharacterized protein n=1 Tax=Mycena pura TaxID=153505 RepID=A0AAD6VT70_9AGAR|nr:hypothetical protein GGX14DRAFT_662748 [Mycena pura]